MADLIECRLTVALAGASAGDIVLVDPDHPNIKPLIPNILVPLSATPAGMPLRAPESPAETLPAVSGVPASPAEPEPQEAAQEPPVLPVGLLSDDPPQPELGATDLDLL